MIQTNKLGSKQVAGAVPRAFIFFFLVVDGILNWLHDSLPKPVVVFSFNVS